MFMNEQQLYEYRMNKFKDNAFIVYITVLGVALFLAMMVKFC